MGHPFFYTRGFTIVGLVRSSPMDKLSIEDQNSDAMEAYYEMKRIEAHEVIVHGIEHEQYFQGCGVSFTEFTDVATGIGNDAYEAFDDALEALAQSGWDVDQADAWEDAPAAATCVLSADDHEDMHVYVSVRVR